jgi:hypothetical protein
MPLKLLFITGKLEMLRFIRRRQRFTERQSAINKLRKRLD